VQESYERSWTNDLSGNVDVFNDLTALHGDSAHKSRAASGPRGVSTEILAPSDRAIQSCALAGLRKCMLRCLERKSCDIEKRCEIETVAVKQPTGDGLCHDRYCEKGRKPKEILPSCPVERWTMQIAKTGKYCQTVGTSPPKQHKIFHIQLNLQ
jgi:hypothetical protein